MKNQRILVTSLAVLGVAGIAGAGLIVSRSGTPSVQPDALFTAEHSVPMMLISDSAENADQAAPESGCPGEELFVQEGQQGQQAGPRRGGAGQQQGGGPQQGMRVMRGPQGPMILRDPKVQKELALSEQQIGQIQAELDKLRPEGGPGVGGPGGQGQGGRPGGQGQAGGQGQGGQGQGGRPGAGGAGQGGPGQGGPGQGGPGGMMGEKVKAFETALKGILNETQFTRYSQLSLQSAGPMAFMRPDVVEKLGITQAQQEQMRAVMEASRPARPEPNGQGGQGEPPQPPDPAQMKQREEKLMADLLNVLSATQRGQWATMIGKKFEFTQGQPRQGGGQRPGGGGGGAQAEGVTF